MSAHQQGGGSGGTVTLAAHAASHGAAGTDPVTIAGTQVTGLGSAAFAAIGTAASQVAAGTHSHLLGALTNVSTSGATNGQVLAYGTATQTWAPANAGGTATATLDSLSDVDVGTAVTGQILALNSGIWGPVTLPGASLNLTDLQDVAISSPSNGQVVTWNAATSKWNAAAAGVGSATVSWMDTPEAHGALGDLKVFSTASITAGTSRLTVSGAGFVNADVGKTIYWASSAAAGAEMAKIKTRVSSTQVDLQQVSGTAVYNATGNATGGLGAFFTDDTAAIQAAVNNAKANNRLMIGLRPGGRYGITSSIDMSNYQGLRIEGLGGGAYPGQPNSSGVQNVQLGGAVVFGCNPTGFTMFSAGNANGTDASTDIVTHNGMHINRVGFGDPTHRKVHTGILTQFQTRSRVEKCHFVGLAIGWKNSSGAKDASWTSARDCHAMGNGVSFQFYNATPDGSVAPTGAMAITIDNCAFNIGGGEVGIDWYGGQYGRIYGGKLDMDGANCVGYRFRGGVNYPADVTAPDTYPAGQSPSAGMISVYGVSCEATGTNMNNNSIVFDVQGGATSINFHGCHVGGSGAAQGIGYAIGVNGTGVCDDIMIVGGRTINRAICLWVGANAQNLHVGPHKVGGNGKFIQVDSGATETWFTDIIWDAASDQMLTTSRCTFSTTAPGTYFRNLKWRGGSSHLPQFAGPPPSTFGRVGCLAYDKTNDKVYAYKAGGWTIVI